MPPEMSDTPSIEANGFQMSPYYIASSYAPKTISLTSQRENDEIQLRSSTYTTKYYLRLVSMLFTIIAMLQYYSRSVGCWEKGRCTINSKRSLGGWELKSKLVMDQASYQRTRRKLNMSQKVCSSPTVSRSAHPLLIRRDADAIPTARLRNLMKEAKRIRQVVDPIQPAQYHTQISEEIMQNGPYPRRQWCRRRRRPLWKHMRDELVSLPD